MPVDAWEGRDALHGVSAPDRIINIVKLDEADQLAIAVMPRAAALEAIEAAEVAHEHVVSHVDGQLRQE